MSKFNMPLYRAKKIDSDEYVDGYLINKDKILEYCPAPTEMGTLQCVEGRHYFNIDPTTLAIHFLDMTDSQGNRIFASLSEDGKGGEIIHHKKPYCKDERKYYEWVVIFDIKRLRPFAEREYWNPSRVPLSDILNNPKSEIICKRIQQ